VFLKPQVKALFLTCLILELIINSYFARDLYGKQHQNLSKTIPAAYSSPTSNCELYSIA